MVLLMGTCVASAQADHFMSGKAAKSLIRDYLHQNYEGYYTDAICRPQGYTFEYDRTYLYRRWACYWWIWEDQDDRDNLRFKRVACKGAHRVRRSHVDGTNYFTAVLFKRGPSC
jgi:hypothetical protein